MSDGALYVEVMPSTRGIKGSIEKDLSGQFQAAEKSGSSFFGKVGSWAKAGAVAIGAMVATVGALAIGGGISRALNIEDATAKLKGLGNDAQTVEQIMTNALAAVKGTAFGLDAAATIAASAVAAGVKPGQELEKYLKLTADAATIAGTSLGEMGSILNKVQTQGRAYTQELNQLADRGIPIFQWLADEYGVTADELRKMVEQGEVDSATFRKVIEENIGGAALASADTTRGAFRNMMTALSRLGVVFLGDGLAGAKTFFQEVTVIIDGVAERIKPFVETVQGYLGGLFQIEGMGEKFLAFVDGIDISAIIDLFTSARGSFIEQGVQIVGAIIEGLIGALPAIQNSFVSLITTIVGLIASQGPALLAGAVTLFLGLITGLVEVLPGLIETVIGLIPVIITTIVGLIPALIEGAISLFQGLITALVTVIPELLVMIVEMLPLIIESLISLIPTLIEGAIALFMALIEAIPVIIPLLIETVIGLLPVLIESLFSMIPALIDAAVQLFVALVTAIPVITPKLIVALVDLLPTMVETILGLIPTLFEAGLTLFMAILEALPVMVPALVDAFIKMGPAMVDAIIRIVPKLIDAGKALIQGLIDGIGSMIGAVGDAVGGIMDFVGGFFPHSPAKHGPLSGAGWTAIKESGGALWDQWAEGLSSADVSAAVSHIVSIPDAFVGSSAAASAAGAGTRMELVLENGERLSGYVRARADDVVKSTQYRSSVRLAGGEASL